MPGSAPPRMPQATPANAAGPIAVVKMLARAIDHSRDGHSPGGCGMPISRTNSSQKNTAPDNATIADLAVDRAALVIRGGEDQPGQREQVAEPRHDHDIDDPDRQHAARQIGAANPASRITCRRIRLKPDPTCRRGVRLQPDAVSGFSRTVSDRRSA